MATRVEPAERLDSTGWRSWWPRSRRLAHELGRFGIVGVVALIVDTAIYNAFWAHTGVYTAAIISTTVSATVAFVGNRFWTWRHRATTSVRREYVLYAIFNVIGLSISLACLWISHDLLGSWAPGVFHTRLADNIAKQGFGLVLGTAFRFWAYRRYVFAAPPAALAPEATPVTPA